MYVLYSYTNALPALVRLYRIPINIVVQIGPSISK